MFPFTNLPSPPAGRKYKIASTGGFALGRRVGRAFVPRLNLWLPPAWVGWLVLVFLIMGGAILYEMRTSSMQAWLLSTYAAKLSYTVEPGPSQAIVFPEGGPFDKRRGYTEIPSFRKRLEARGFRVLEQARFSPELMRVAKWGITPPYREPVLAGLVIGDENGTILYDARPSDRAFKEFREIPPIIIRTLLFVENRELAEAAGPHQNPVVEWDRLLKAGLLYAGNRAGLALPVEGASTLAVQLEKYRHSWGGRTESAMEKLRQIAGATLKVYRDGPDTDERRKEIILDYLNTMPLAAAPGYGDLYGLGDGLYAWFGLNLKEISEALAAPDSAQKAHAFKHVLALMCAVRAPSYYLLENPAGLYRRMQHYTGALEESGIINTRFAHLVRESPISPLPRAPLPPPTSFIQRKATNLIRTRLVELLGVAGTYELDRLDLQVETSIDPRLQGQVLKLFQELKRPEFVDARGLRAERLLSQGDPADVVYSLTLFERTSRGNVLRVQADSLDKPFDLNQGMKLELGSTAKLRTLAHYLEVMASLHGELYGLDARALAEVAQRARDPLTRWAAETVQRDPVEVEPFLEKALDRPYSASPHEVFFTGGGAHTFSNFDPKENHLVLTVREAMRHSTNLVFVRLMRDLVRFHQARLPYDADAVLAEPQHPQRERLLGEIAEEEAKQILSRAYQSLRGLSPDALVDRLLGSRKASVRHLTLLFLAWNPGANREEDLIAWLEDRLGSVSREQVRRVMRGHDVSRLTLADYGYLLKRHPLEVWCGGELARNAELSWHELRRRGQEAQRISFAWLFKTRNRRAQDLRLRVQIERDAFARMTPFWRNFAFPFDRLVPSYASALGSSSDRPVALAELMGIILNEGRRIPTVRVSKLILGEGTPYHTVFEAVPEGGEQVMPAPVARLLRRVLGDIVEAGTARRLAGAFTLPDGTHVAAGGKTGSGDNRFESVGRHGQVIASRAVSRTATFAFYIGDRYFGVLTAFVPGPGAQDYRFTSALPVTVLKLLAPGITARLAAASPLSVHTE